MKVTFSLDVDTPVDPSVLAQFIGWGKILESGHPAPEATQTVTVEPINTPPVAAEPTVEPTTAPPVAAVETAAPQTAGPAVPPVAEEPPPVPARRPPGRPRKVVAESPVATVETSAPAIPGEVVEPSLPNGIETSGAPPIPHVATPVPQAAPLIPDMGTPGPQVQPIEPAMPPQTVLPTPPDGQITFRELQKQVQAVHTEFNGLPMLCMKKHGWYTLQNVPPDKYTQLTQEIDEAVLARAA